jgi:four helix bundle protein
MKGDDISDRLLEFAVRIIQLVDALPNTLVGRHIGRQVLGSGTSPGANYEEARGAESKADFLHKLGIVLKELSETRYWLKLLIKSKLIPPKRIEDVFSEADELCKIIGKSVITVKKKQRMSRR